MKKITRFLSLIVLLGILMSLCGCSYLDDLRATRAVVTEDGTIRFFDGTEYKLLPESKYFDPAMDDRTTVYAAKDEDVPLLLIADFGDYGYKSENGQFIEVYPQEYSCQRYCRADSYDIILSRINSGFTPDVYAYSYYDYKTDSDQFYTLTAQQAEALEAVLATQEPYQLPSNAILTYMYSVRLYQCSRDFLFRKYAVLIFYNEGKYYLKDTDSLIYDVPQELNLVFDAIVEKELKG